jgi:DNA helicase HerA-like ATPase
LIGKEPSRLKDRARSLRSVYTHRFDGGFGGLNLPEWSLSAGWQPIPLRLSADKEWLLLTAAELAAMWHLPCEHAPVHGISYLKRPITPLPGSLVRLDKGLLLGMHKQRSQDVPVYLPRKDLEAGHLVIPSGRTGVGKTTLIKHLCGQLARESDRPSLVFLDPHGDAALSLALSQIPPEREADVVLWELGDDKFPVGLPLFQSPRGVSQEVFTQTTFAALKLIFREHWSPTRMEDVFWALCSTLCALPGSTLLDAPKLFSDALFRRRLISQLDDQAALEFWAQYEQLSESARQEIVRPVLNRLRKFYRSQAVRNLVCRTDGLDLGALLDRGAVLLISLAGPSIQAEADLLGELITARLHLELLARLSQPPEKRRRTYIAVDESQRYPGASLPILLSEGRKLSATLILATQYLSGWGESLAESVLGNVGTLVVFRCGPNDSRHLAASLKPFTPDQLEDLDRFEAIVKLQINGQTAPAFDIKTLPIEASADEAALERIRLQTRKRYGRPRQQIEREIARMNQPVALAWEGGDIDEE